MPWKPSEPGERPTLGWLVLDWIQDYLIVPDGPAAGAPLTFTNEQAQFVLQFYEVSPGFTGPPIQGRALVNARLVRRAVLSRPKGWGKALALDTILPTPTGWTTMADVQVGDELLTEDGIPTRVIAATEVMVDRPCYRVEFRDGTAIVADADHLWPMDEFHGASKRMPRTVTTAQMHEAGMRYGRPLTEGRTKCTTDGVARWRTLRTPVLDCPEAEFPIPPYLLGYWLGDGDRDCPRITIHRDDIPSFEAACDLLGIEHGEPRPTHGETYRIRFGRGWALVALRSAGLLFNKHIPPWVMRASHKQRLQVLQGLMDSDGTISSDGGKIELCFTDSRLAADSVELIRTLGLYPRMTAGAAVLNGQHVGTRYRINFTAYNDEPVFQLERKASRLRPPPRQIPYSQVRTVVDVQPVDSVPVRCVTVANPTSLYLAGEGLIPTHNSPLVAAICLVEALGPVVLDGWDVAGQPVGREWQSLGFKPKVQVVAASEDQTANTWDPLLEMARNGPVIDAYDIEPMETFVNVPRGLIEPVTASAKSREGFRPVFAAADQTESWDASNGGPKLAATIRRNLAKVGGSLMETPNAFRPGRGSVAEASFEAYDHQLGGRTRLSTGILFDHREAPPDTNPADEESLREGLRVAYGESLDRAGGWVSEDRLVAEMWDPSNDPEDSRAYYLNQIRSDSGAWLNLQDWAKNAHPERVVPAGETIVLGFDGSKTDDSTGLVGCCMSDGHVFVIQAWEKPDDPAEAKGWQVDRVDVDRVVHDAYDTYDVVAHLADIREFEAYVDQWGQEFGERLLVDATTGKYRHPVSWDMQGKVAEFTAAAGRALTDIIEGEFSHDGSRALQRHALNARRSPNRYGTSISKDGRESPRKIDLMVCAIIARHGRRLVLASDAWKNRGKKKQPGNVVAWGRR